SGVSANGDAYLVSEWLEGETLAARLARGAISPADTMDLGTRVAEALGEAHALGIIHRDIKPANLFLEGGSIGRVKILDFGLAREIDRTQPLTVSGALLGTPGYMAPEQARALKTVDVRADVFSLGCVLYHCLSGKPPFVGDTLIAVLLSVALEEP